MILSLFSGCIDIDAEYDAYKDMIYQEINDIDPNLVSLDIYIPKRSTVRKDTAPPFQSSKNVNNISGNSKSSEIITITESMPVLIWVHGGGWRSGDKANQLRYKIPYFINEGWIFISVNYRLSPYDIPEDPKDLDPNRIQYPIHSQDVAAAIAWVHEHIDEYDGDPSNLSLMGHSAGAGIVASIGTNESFLGVHNLSLDILNHIVCLDTAAYDIRERCETGAMLYLNAFGINPDVWDAASPLNNIEIDEQLPSFFVVVQGSQNRINQNRMFVEAINQTGTITDFVITQEYDHSEVNQMIGHPNDDIITPVLSSFLGFFSDEP